MEKKTIVIVEDHTILRKGLRELLNASGAFEVVGEAEDGMSGIRTIKQKMPDLAILDISMPKMGGISVIKEISNTNPETKIVVLTMHKDEEYALEALRSGAQGYCLKISDPEELLLAIQQVLSGHTYITPKISELVLEGYLDSNKKLKKQSSWDSLTQREKEVLKMVGEGYRNKDIADFLCISFKTVEKHRANIMEKLNLHSASALTAYAIKKKLVVK